MQIHVDGYRSSDENWLYAHNLPSQELPELSREEHQVAEQLGVSAEDYARGKFAGDRTRGELEQRASRVGNLVDAWLWQNLLAGSVKAVWLKTFQGKFRVDIETEEQVSFCFLDEDLVDALLDSGSLEAQHQIERSLAANFGLVRELRAS